MAERMLFIGNGLILFETLELIRLRTHQSSQFESTADSFLFALSVKIGHFICLTITEFKG